jgi:hypothetical protein
MIEILKQLVLELKELLLNAVPELVGALIAVWGAFKLFKRQIQHEDDNRDEQDNNKQRELLNYSNYLIRSILNTFRIEKEDLASYSENIRNAPYITLTHSNALATNDVKRIQNILEGADYLVAYTSHIGSDQSKLEQLDMIIKSLDYLDVTRIQLENITTLAVQNDYDRRLKYNEILIENLRKIKDYCYENITEYIEILTTILPVQIVYGNDQNMNLDQHVRFFTKPLIGLIQHKFYADVTLKRIEFELQMAVGIVNHLTFNNLEFSRKVDMIVSDIGKTLEVLNKNSEALEMNTQDNTG